MEIGEKEERATIKADSTVVRPTQRPLICTRLPEVVDVTDVVIREGRLEKKKKKRGGGA